MWTLRDLIHKILQFVEAPQELTSINKSYRCFPCPTYFGSLASFSDHQELHHSKLPSTSVRFKNVCSLIDFSTEAVNSKFQIHRLKLEGWGVLEPFNRLVSQKESFIRFVGFFVEVDAQPKIRPH